MSRINTLLHQADQSVTARNFPLAIKLVNQALSVEPDNAYAYSIMARISLLKGDIDAARLQLFTSLKFNPENAYVFYLLARTEYDNKDYAGANGWITKSLEYQPENADYLGFKSFILLFGFDHITEARQLSSAGLKKDPDNIICLITSYHIELKLKNDVAAQTLITNAIKKNPNDPDLQALLTDILLKQGNREDAYHSIMTSLRQVPGSEYYQARLKEVLAGNIFLKKGGRQILLSGWFQKTIKLLALIALFPGSPACMAF